MILEIFAVRDIRTDRFGNPMFLINTGDAIRAFSDAVNSKDKTSLLSAHPEDFELFRLGTYDPNDASFVTSRPSQVALAKDLLTSSN